MSKKDNTEEEVEVPRKSNKSEAYVAFEKVVEAYKVSNPVKYALKREAFEKKLASL